MASAYLNAEKTALRLIARAEQSCQGLALKLEKRGHETACIQQVLLSLQELGLVDDRRFVRLWLESRISRRINSPRQLLAGLCSRGIDRELAESSIRTILNPETEFKLLQQYHQKLQRKSSFRKNLKKLTDINRYLKQLFINQGFSSVVIEMFFNEVI